MEVAMKTEGRTAKEEAEVLRAVRAMIARGMLPDMASHVAATMLHNNDLLAEIPWVPAND